MSVHTNPPAAISFSQIQTEFTGSSLSSWYRGGSLVPNTGTNASIPSSGSISLSQFYGAAKTLPYTPKIYSFTTVGTTSVTVPAGMTSIAILMCGGGGGGGSGSYDQGKWDGGGGGGGGGVLYVPSFPVGAGQVLKITVGAGGTGGLGYAGNDGGSSSIVDGNGTTYYIAPGGGGGGGGRYNNPTVAAAAGLPRFARSGYPGGSGGGANGTDYNIQGAFGGQGFYTYPGYINAIYGNNGGCSMNNGFAGGGGGAGTTTNNSNQISVVINQNNGFPNSGAPTAVGAWPNNSTSNPYKVLVNNGLINPWTGVNNGGANYFIGNTGNPPPSYILSALNGQGQGQNGYISGYGTSGYLGLGFSGAGGDAITLSLGGTNYTMGAGGGGGGSYQMGGTSVQDYYCPSGGGNGPGGSGGGGAGGGGGTAGNGVNGTGYGSGGGGAGGKYPATAASGGSGSAGAVFIYG